MRDLQKLSRDVARELARLYSTMSHEDLDELEAMLIPMKFKKNQAILTEGEVCENFYYIHKGLIRQFYTKNGKEVTEHLGVEGGMIYCIESLFREEPTRLQIEALEQSILFAIPKKRLEQVALHNQNIQILYRKILERSLINSQVHADLVRFETAQDRYKRFFKMHPQVSLRAPLVYIASYLQMTPETLSRVRAVTLID
ncbi:MAG: Crp/Fnr family transcriptional regulator [Bacteroidaceae bacterium]|nr:Crp/Fnr family transcriptional regulator [Bacteroidaceae bacterium]